MWMRCGLSITCRSREYPAGALAARVFIASGIRGMERGSVSMDRDKKGNDVPADLELLRLARSPARLHHVALPVRGRPDEVAA